MSCLCVVGLHAECISIQMDDADEYGTCCCITGDEDIIRIAPELEKRGPGRPQKENEDIEDVTSTGRKRAAELFPVTSGMVCEWSRLLFAGGGPVSIVGCDSAILSAGRGESAIHHGPDKSTLSNFLGNCHRICTTCHNRWHTLNDPFYGKRPDKGQPFIPLTGTTIPHDAETKATEKQMAYNEKWWATNPKQRKEMRPHE